MATIGLVVPLAGLGLPFAMVRFHGRNKKMWEKRAPAVLSASTTSIVRMSFVSGCPGLRNLP